MVLVGPAQLLPNPPKTLTTYLQPQLHEPQRNNSDLGRVEFKQFQLKTDYPKSLASTVAGNLCPCIFKEGHCCSFRDSGSSMSYVEQLGLCMKLFPRPLDPVHPCWLLFFLSTEVLLLNLSSQLGPKLLTDFPGLQGLLYLTPYCIYHNLLLLCSSDAIFYSPTWSFQHLVHSRRQIKVQSSTFQAALCDCSKMSHIPSCPKIGQQILSFNNIPLEPSSF